MKNLARRFGILVTSALQPALMLALLSVAAALPATADAAEAPDALVSVRRVDENTLLIYSNPKADGGSCYAPVRREFFENEALRVQLVRKLYAETAFLTALYAFLPDSPASTYRAARIVSEIARSPGLKQIPVRGACAAVLSLLAAVDGLPDPSRAASVSQHTTKPAEASGAGAAQRTGAATGAAR